MDEWGWIDDADLIDLEPIAPGGWTVPLRFQSGAAVFLAGQFLLAFVGVLVAWTNGSLVDWQAAALGAPMVAMAGMMGWVAGQLAEEGTRTGT